MQQKKISVRAKEITHELKKLFPHPEMVLKYKNNWELLVAVELSAQCTDNKVNEVTERLFKKYPKLNDYLDAKPSEFEKDIFQTGFYHNKAKNILAAAKIVKEKFHGTLPKTMDEMLTIPGVGRKTANVILGNAYGVVDGIVVDTHMIRLARLWKLTNKNTAEQIEKDLMELLPKEEWFMFARRVFTYGRTVCTARVKDHSRCPLAKYEK